ncbi:6,7-dimethyl-8-ribityllumazine synthase [Candidatus Micrarchaeota archaeon]|nr:6,7-dimethyl-8-ribityllumazine synthase [Candidatus Micrarchaeota archaeon]
MGVRQGKGNDGQASEEKKLARLGFVIGQFDKEISSSMEKAATEFAKSRGALVQEKIHVPGVFDMQLAIKKLLLNKEIDAVVLLGAVIKGRTKHDEVIVRTTASTAVQLSLEFNKPVTLGVIGPDATEKDAEQRKEEYAERAVYSAIELTRKLRR